MRLDPADLQELGPAVEEYLRHVYGEANEVRESPFLSLETAGSENKIWTGGPLMSADLGPTDIGICRS